MIKDEYNEHEEASIKAGRALDEIGRDIVDVMYTVHREMGPGLAEAVYHECVCMEFETRNIPFCSQEPIAIEYKDQPLAARYIADILVEGRVIVELKAVKELLPVHEAQILNYLKLTDTKLGYLVNFNVPMIKDGIKRRVNNY
jgi:GxxExxY protein